MKYNGQLKEFPQEVVEKMLERQVEQGNKRDVTVFERLGIAYANGFAWDKTEEGWNFWSDVIGHKKFNVFFKKYPKEFKPKRGGKVLVWDEEDNIKERIFLTK